MSTSSECGWQIPTQFICQLMIRFPNHSLCVSRKVWGKYIMVQSAITCINTSCDFKFSRKFLLHKSWLTILIKRSPTQKLSLLTPISHHNFFLSWMFGKFILSTKFWISVRTLYLMSQDSQQFLVYTCWHFFFDNTYCIQRWALSGQIWLLNPIFRCSFKLSFFPLSPYILISEHNPLQDMNTI